jgi:rSAM/selenodomain-associated transferase 1
MRAARRQPLLDLGLVDRRSGYALEMVAAAGAGGWRVVEVDVAYARARGVRRSPVRTGHLDGAARHAGGAGSCRSALSGVHLLVLAKAPVAGRVKTRLCPPFTPEQAAQLAEAALRDTLDAVAGTPAAARTVALDGRPGDWLPPSFTVLPQRGTGLDERLAAAFEDAWAHTAAPLLLVGMDTPQLTPALLTAAVDHLLSAGTDAVLGLAADGGWWALGLRRPDASVLLGVPMSTATTGAAQQASLADAGFCVAALPVLIDVDDAEDARTVAAQCPATRFAEVHRALVGTATGTATGVDRVEQVTA